MADLTLTAIPRLAFDLAIGPNRITARHDLALVSVATPLGGADALDTALQVAFGLARPTPLHSTRAGDMQAIAITADQMLLVFPHALPDAADHIAAGLEGTGYVTEQTDAWLILDLSGPDSRAALERICPIDLHPQVFPAGASARTVMEHMGALILCTGPDAFRLLAASSSAESFAHAVEVSYRNVA